MKPSERLHPRAPMPDALRRHHFGPVQPMQQPGLFARLIEWLRR